mmetsp:Transcript_19994/g.28725  ORF Transcript_19994/g.28725 Transcript_19994/m.28725 type:complete len:97 (-) Transcript_19994:131-421(-)|eukprot:CAMPEP_0185026040 /NCGR_PEP_ID=MMETSP1103-20130426/9660_1 /TAXON_ID=36769 /ORGANISM="Paraphysomonas bandaiensis, Strain Caron Lab Isolate" /LENGTH=96 /DNA_ID=CAMNT_0027559465 /DNA_START=29 /DNA_END=319 /DNA_ORIENTATION=-
MVKVWFPDMYMRLVGKNLSRPVGKAVFYVKPSMTKWEVREYLTKIYNMDILKVETALHLGRWKRFYGKRDVVAYKRRNFKKAYVDFVNSVPKDSTA